MKLQQLRYLAAVADNKLNISATAERLYTSQPGISKQIRQLENELGLELFHRSGRSLTSMTPAGLQVLERAHRVLREVQNIRSVADEIRDEERGTLAIATTHTQARYVLPKVVERFRRDFPGVQLELHQGTAEQINTLLAEGDVDLAIASGNSLPDDAITFPCYQWHPLVVVPKNHPLAGENRVDIERLNAYPLITYSFSTRRDSSLLKPFSEAGLSPEVALTARDADIIKTYVKLGLGVGVIASMAFDATSDPELVPLDVSGVFPEITTWVALRRGDHLRGYTRSFIEHFAPSLTGKITTALM